MTTPLDEIRAELLKGDDLIDVTILGDPNPTYLTGTTATDRATAKARAYYLNGELTIDQFEAALDECMANGHGDG